MTLYYAGLSSIRVRLIGKKNFTTQFRDGGKGKTELLNLELNEKCKLRSSIHRGGVGKTKSASTELNWEGKLHGSMQTDGEGKTKPVPMCWTVE